MRRSNTAQPDLPARSRGCFNLATIIGNRLQVAGVVNGLGAQTGSTAKTTYDAIETHAFTDGNSTDLPAVQGDAGIGEEGLWGERGTA